MCYYRGNLFWCWTCLALMNRASLCSLWKSFLWVYAFISFVWFLRRVDAVQQSKCAEETIVSFVAVLFFTACSKVWRGCFCYSFSRSQCSLWFSNGVLLTIQHDYPLYNDQTRYLAFPSPCHFIVLGAFYPFCSGSSQNVYVLVNCSCVERQNSVLFSWILFSCFSP